MPSSRRSSIDALITGWKAALQALDSDDPSAALDLIEALDADVGALASMTPAPAHEQLGELRATARDLERRLVDAIAKTDDELRQVRNHRKALGGYRRVHAADAQQLDHRA